MPTANVWMAADGTQAVTRVGGYVHIAALPSHPLSIVDLDGGALGYFRVVWRPNGFLGGGGGLWAEYSYGGSHTDLSLMADPENVAGAWIWYWCAFGGFSGGGGGIQGQSWGPGGVTAGSATAHIAPGSPSVAQAVACNLGWGVNLSGTYDDFPNAAGYEQDTLMCFSGNGMPWHANDAPLQTPVTGDPDPSQPYVQFLYVCRQPLGPQDTITDSSANHLDLVAGPNAARIVANGPY